MAKARSYRRKVGNVLRIPLGRGEHGYAWTLEEPLVALFDYLHMPGTPEPALSEIVRNKIAYRILVMNTALTRGPWELIGNEPPPPAVLVPPWFFKRDLVSRKLFKTLTGEEEIPITVAEGRTLEAAAVWEREHVEDRLRDHFAGRPSVWLESLREDLEEE